MISFQMTDEQRQMQRLARRFAEEEMRPVAPECDEQERFPREVYEKAHRAGLITYRFPGNTWEGASTASSPPASSRRSCSGDAPGWPLPSA